MKKISFVLGSCLLVLFFIFFAVQGNENIEGDEAGGDGIDTETETGDEEEGLTIEERMKENFQVKGEQWIHDHWYVFSAIFPREYRQDLESIYWLDAGGASGMFVGRDCNNPKKLLLAFEYELGEYENYLKPMYFHEFAHLLTLNEDQVEVDEAAFMSEDEKLLDEEEANCPTFYSWGCHKESSYLNEFYNQFWADIEDEYGEIDWNDGKDYEDFFYTYEDRFFNTYQGTFPEEDIAESFTFFIMLKREDIQRKSETKYNKANFFLWI